jgi:hypothetical protein
MFDLVEGLAAWPSTDRRGYRTQARVSHEAEDGRILGPRASRVH